MEQIKGVKHNSYEQEQGKLEQDHEAAGKKGCLTLALAPGSEQSLHNQLVGPVTRSGQEHTAHKA